MKGARELGESDRPGRIVLFLADQIQAFERVYRDRKVFGTVPKVYQMLIGLLGRADMRLLINYLFYVY
jgi:hypothetical protein